jgi:Lipoprotein confined to pathogenic Mycobacterium
VLSWPIPGTHILMRFATLVCATALICAACGFGTASGGINEQFATLHQRPDIERAQSRYLGMLDTIRTELVARLGIAAWQPDEDGLTGSACGFDFPDVGGDGEIRRFGTDMSPGNIPDNQWADAVAIVSELAKPYGFGAPAVVVDRPSDHEVSLRDSYGAELLFGTAENTILSVGTGCHLTEAAHQRGTPA